MMSIHQSLIPRSRIVTSNDRGPAINVIAWVTMCIMILTVLTKLISKIDRSRRLMSDDLLAVLAMVFGVAETIALNVAVGNGLGSRQETLTHQKLLTIEKSQYAAEILFIVTLFFSKLVTIRFVEKLAPFAWVIKFTSKTYIFTTVWALAAIFGISFQCQSPDFWALFSTNCFNQTLFWVLIGVFDIINEAILVYLPLMVLRPTLLDRTKKVSITIAFSARAILIPLIIIRLYFTSFAQKSLDRTFNEFGLFLTVQIQANSAIVLCCFPFLKTFIDKMQSGFSTSDLMDGPCDFINQSKSKTEHSFREAARGNTINLDDNDEVEQNHRESFQLSRLSSFNAVEGCHTPISTRQVTIETTITVSNEKNDGNAKRNELDAATNSREYNKAVERSLIGWNAS